MTLRVCVLGATGFIGGQIARAAIQAGWHVRAARRNPTNVGAIGDLPVEWVCANLNDAASLVVAMQGCDALFHAAASYPQDFRRIEHAVAQAKAEMERVLDAARSTNIKRVVYTSTVTTVFRPKSVPNLSISQREEECDESSFYVPDTAGSAYYEAKFAMEQNALRAHDLDVVTLLPAAVFGPGDVKPTTSVVIRDAARGRFPFYFDAKVNCVDVRDVARSHIAAVERGRAGERYILGGHNLSLYELLSTVCRIAGRHPPRVRLSRETVARLIHLTDALPFVHLPENIRTFEFWAPVSSRKAEAELGHTARPFEETVRDTLAWFG